MARGRCVPRFAGLLPNALAQTNAVKQKLLLMSLKNVLANERRDHPGESDQLAFANGQVGATFAKGVVERELECRDSVSRPRADSASFEPQPGRTTRSDYGKVC